MSLAEQQQRSHRRPRLAFPAAVENAAPLILHRKVSFHAKKKKRKKGKGTNDVIRPHSNNDVEGLAAT